MLKDTSSNLSGLSTTSAYILPLLINLDSNPRWLRKDTNYINISSNTKTFLW